MRIKFKATALAAAAGALMIAVPAAAHPGPGDHPGNTNPPAQSHACAPHKVAYIVAGVITSSSMAPNGDGTWSGTLTYTVTHHNHWAKNDSGSATLADVKVKFDGGTTTFAMGEKVTLIGKLEVVRSHPKNACSNPGPQGSPTFRMVVVHPSAA